MKKLKTRSIFDKCTCKLCQWNPSIKRIIKKCTPKEKKVLLELYDAYEAEATDASFWEAKFKGTWPK